MAAGDGLAAAAVRHAWQAELQKYLSSPQGRLINRGFTIVEFKEIFWLEFIHRLWGRLIGVVLRPAAGLVLDSRKTFARTEATPGGAAGIGRTTGGLGAGRMVASGLVDRPSVSHYRLAGHLLLAVALYAYTVWLILELGPQGARRDDPRTRRDATVLIGLLFVVLTWGALMAGLRAGSAHNTFPTMSGHWIPPGLFEQSPWWTNLFENPTTVQFSPSLARQAARAGGAGHGFARASCRSRPGRSDGARAAKPRNRHDPDGSRHTGCNIAPGRSGPIADFCDRRAASRDTFSGEPCVGYCRRMSGTSSRPSP
jgi:heme A synthase